MRDKFIACSFLVLIVKGIIQMKIFTAQIYCLSYLVLIVKGITRMKIFPAQIYCSFLFGFDSKRYYTNENISSTNLLFVRFWFS